MKGKRYWPALALLCLLALAITPSQAQRTDDYYAPEVLDRPLGIEPLPNGNVLITDAGGAFYTLTDDSLMEVDRQKGIVWQYVGDMSFPHSAERLADGTTLVSDTANDRVFQVDAAGTIVWTSEDWGEGSGTLSDGSHLRYPNDIELLENGHFLVTDRNNDRVIEITPQGEVLWQYGVLNRPHNADRLSNGNTLICNSEEDLIVEVNPQGKVVWEFGGDLLNWPRDADRLPDGNTLVTDSRNGRVLTVTPAGKVIWSYTGLGLPYEADALSNGNILIADNNHKRVIEVNPGGEVVWSFRNFPDDYPDTLQNGDFEQDADGNGIPDGWYPADMNAEGPVSFPWDTPVVQHGQHSAGIRYQGEGKASYLQVITVESGTTYHFSGYLRSDIRHGVIAYQLWYQDDMGGPIDDPITLEPYLQGATDWAEVRGESTAPEGAAAVQIWCHAVAIDGQAWYDNVSWEEAGGLSLPLLIGIGVAIVVVVVLVRWLLRRRPKPTEA